MDEKKEQQGVTAGNSTVTLKRKGIQSYLACLFEPDDYILLVENHFVSIGSTNGLYYFNRLSNILQEKNPENLKKIAKCRYVILNPIKPDAKNKGLESIANFQNFLIEHDCLPYQSQLDFIDYIAKTYGIEPATMVFSGNKSVHTVYRSEEKLSREQWIAVSKDLAKLYPFCCLGSLGNPCTLTRLPGVLNEKGSLQTAVIDAQKKVFSYTKGLQPIVSKIKRPLDRSLRIRLEKFYEGDISSQNEKPENLTIEICAQMLSSQYPTKVIDFITDCTEIFLDESDVFQKAFEKSLQIDAQETAILEKKQALQKELERKKQLRRENGMFATRLTDTYENQYKAWVLDNLQNLNREKFLSVIAEVTGHPVFFTSEKNCYCPFHNDENASASIKQSNGKYVLYCGVCQGFDAIDVYMKGLNLTFTQAAERLFGPFVFFCEYCNRPIYLSQGQAHNVLDNSLHKCMGSAKMNFFVERKENPIQGYDIENANIEDSKIENCEKPKVLPLGKKDCLDTERCLPFESWSAIYSKMTKCLSENIRFALDITLPTGAGKTTNSLKEIVLPSLKTGLRFVFFCASKKNARSVYRLLFDMLVEKKYQVEKTLGLVLSSRSDIEDSEGKKIASSIKINYALPVLITTYGYLGTKGQQNFGYIEAYDMLEQRIAIFDEIQTMDNKTLIDFALTCQFVRDSLQSTYSRSTACPSSRLGCANCEICCNYKLPDPRYGNRRVIREFKVQNLAQNQYGACEETRLPLLEEFIKGEFQHINSTFFIKDLQSQKLDSFEPSENNKFLLKGTPQPLNDYLANLHKRCINASLRVQFPVYTGNKIPELQGQRVDIELSMFYSWLKYPSGKNPSVLTEADLKDILFPNTPCGEYRYCAFDTFVPTQLMGHIVIDENGHETKYNGSLGIITFSATQKESHALFLGVMKKNGWLVERYNGQSGLQKYNVTSLIIDKNKSFGQKEKGSLSIDRQVDIAKLLLDQKMVLARFLFVNRNKSRANAFARKIVDTHSNQAVIYNENGFVGFFEDCEESIPEDHCEVELTLENPDSAIVTEPQNAQLVKSRLLSTYVRSALMQGENLGDYSLAVIDCRTFIPYAAIGLSIKGLTSQQILSLCEDDARKVLTQACGRLLRDNPNDPKNRIRVFVLHGLDFEFSLDSSVCDSKSQTIVNDWINPKDINDSIVNAVLCALQDKDIPSYKWLLESKPLEQLSHSQRARIDKSREQEKKEKAKNKRQEKLSKARALADQGLLIRDIERKLNLKRDTGLDGFNEIQDYIEKLKALN